MSGQPDQFKRQIMAMAGIGQILVLAAAIVPNPVWAQDAGHGPAAPQMQITEYLGGGYLTFSETCADHGWSGVHQIMIRTQPQGMRGNPDDETQMAVFFSTGVMSFRFDIELETMGQAAPLNQAVYVWNGPYSPEEPTMAISYRTRYGDYIPSGGAHLESVFMTLSNFNEHRGCTATMRVSLGRN